MSRNNIISILSASFFYFGALIIREVHTLIFSPFKKSILFFLMVIIASISIALPYRSFQSGTFNELNTWEYLDGSTWNPAIALPDTDDDVFIQSGHIVNITSLVNINNIEIQANATLMISGSIDLHVGGDWINNGEFIAGSSTVFIDGISSQTIDGVSDFYNLTFLNSPLNLTLATGSITRIANAFVPSADSVSNIAGATIEYNGSVNQSVADFIYHHLIVSNGGRKTMLGNGVLYNSFPVAPTIQSPDDLNPANIRGDLSINSGTILDIASRGLKMAKGSKIYVYGTIDFTTENGFITRVQRDISAGDPVVIAELMMMPNGLIRTANPNGFGLNTLASFRGNGVGSFNVSSASTNGTIEYYATVAQTITNPNTGLFSALQSYNNLIIAGNSTKTWTMADSRNVLGNLTINSTATFALAGAGTEVRVGGNWTNHGTFTHNSKTINFNSTAAAQQIGGTAITTFYNLTNTNTDATGLSLNGIDAIVENSLALNSVTNGKFTIGSNNFTVATGGSIINYSADKYIVSMPSSGSNGRLRQNNLSSGNVRIFPVGTTSYYLPVSITPEENSNDFSVSVFRSTTMDGLPSGTPFASRVKQVDAIWWIGQPVGTSKANVELSWITDALEGSVFLTSPNNKIATWRGISTIPDFWTLAGTGFDNDNVTNFSKTIPVEDFGSNEGYPYLVSLVDLLPNLLKSFKVTPQLNQHQIFWEVLNNHQINYFQVQLSGNGMHFNDIKNISPLTDSKRYVYNNALNINSDAYYRLKISLLNGDVVYSPVVFVKANFKCSNIIKQQPVGQLLYLNDTYTKGASYQLINSSGAFIFTGTITNNSIHLPDMKPGIYYLRIPGISGVLCEKFIKL